MTPEALLLAEAIRRGAGAEGLPAPSLLDANLSWERFHWLVSFHGLTAMVWYGIGEARRNEFPGWLQSALFRECIASAARHRLMADEASRAIETLERSGIPAICIKGPTIAAEYPHWSMRPFSDIDLLTAPSDTDAALRVLSTLGYEPVPKFQRRHWPHISYPHAIVLEHARSGFAIDLHWRVGSGELAGVNLRTEDLIARSRPVRYAGLELAAPTLEDQVLLSVSHGLQHGWQRLIHVCDLISLTNRLGPEAQEALLCRAQRLGVTSERAMALGVSLCEAVLGENLTPTGLRAPARLVGWLLHKIEGCASDPLPKDVATVTVIPNLRNRLRYVWFTACKRGLDHLDNLRRRSRPPCQHPASAHHA